MRLIKFFSSRFVYIFYSVYFAIVAYVSSDISVAYIDNFIFFFTYLLCFLYYRLYGEIKIWKKILLI